MTGRSEFPKDVRRTAYKRSGGICECRLMPWVPGFTAEGCGLPVGPGNLFYEHIQPDGAGGRPDLDNCAVLTKTCWRIKTGWDQPVVAKVERQTDRAIGIGRRPPSSRPIPGSRNSPFKHRLGKFGREAWERRT